MQAIAGQTFRAQNVFDDYEAVKQVAVFRAVRILLHPIRNSTEGYQQAAGVMSYLNSGIAFSQFAMTYDCVHDVWVNWFDRYENVCYVFAI